jgi:hypothetical protein
MTWSLRNVCVTDDHGYIQFVVVIILSLTCNRKWLVTNFITQDRGLLLTIKLLNQEFLLVKLKSSLRKFYGRHHDLVDRYEISVTNDHGYVPLVNTSRSFPHWWFITGFVTRLTRRVPLVEQKLLILSTNRNSWFSSFIVNSNPLSKKSWWEPQALE